MMEQQQIPFVGVPLHCPDCHRLLIAFCEDGSILLAPQSSFRTVAEVKIDEDGIEYPDDCVVSEAVCLKRICKLKRQIRAIREKKGSQ